MKSEDRAAASGCGRVAPRRSGRRRADQFVRRALRISPHRHGEPTGSSFSQSRSRRVGCRQPASTPSPRRPVASAASGAPRSPRRLGPPTPLARTTTTTAGWPPRSKPSWMVKPVLTTRSPDAGLSMWPLSHPVGQGHRRRPARGSCSVRTPAHRRMAHGAPAPADAAASCREHVRRRAGRRWKFVPDLARCRPQGLTAARHHPGSAGHVQDDGMDVGGRRAAPLRSQAVLRSNRYATIRGSRTSEVRSPPPTLTTSGTSRAECHDGLGDVPTWTKSRRHGSPAVEDRDRAVGPKPRRAALRSRLGRWPRLAAARRPRWNPEKSAGNLVASRIGRDRILRHGNLESP